jgi:hypothetical protein
MGNFVQNVGVTILDQEKVERQCVLKVYTKRTLIVIDFDDSKKQKICYLFNETTRTLRTTIDTVLLRAASREIRFRFSSLCSKDLFISAMSLLIY